MNKAGYITIIDLLTSMTHHTASKWFLFSSQPLSFKGHTYELMNFVIIGLDNLYHYIQITP